MSSTRSDGYTVEDGRHYKNPFQDYSQEAAKELIDTDKNDVRFLAGNIILLFYIIYVITLYHLYCVLSYLYYKFSLFTLHFITFS